MQPSFYSPREFIERGKLFIEHYDLETEIVCPDKKMILSIPKQERVCRFCNKKYPEVTFRDDAHVIPESIGNRYLISDFECDSCNKQLGKYDDQFSHFLGVSRTLNKTNGKEGIPTYKSPDKNIRAGESDFYGVSGTIVISRQNLLDKSFTFDAATGIGTLTCKKPSYKPLLVYKSILKMALTCLNAEHLQHYKLAIKYLTTTKLDNDVKGACMVCSYNLPFGMGWEVPFAAIYKKRNRQSPIPSHIFMLHFQNAIHQIFIPLHAEDLKIINTKTIPIYWCPPFFATPKDALETPICPKDYDLSSTELVKGEEDTITFKLHPDTLKELVSANLETGKIVNASEWPTTISKIILVKPGTTINFPK
jgi:HNH endonuclease